MESSKVKFATDKLDERGLYGPPDGLRLLNYEFVIPATEAALAAVQQAAPGAIQVHRNSRGRVGAGENEWLCIGETGPGWKEKLAALCALTFVKEIRQCFWE